jgi:hypothetical protein
MAHIIQSEAYDAEYGLPTLESEGFEQAEFHESRRRKADNSFDDNDLYSGIGSEL